MEEVLGGAGPPALGDAAQHPSMDTLSITALGFREGERWMNEKTPLFGEDEGTQGCSGGMQAGPS